MGAAPETPAWMPAQVSSVPMPSGDTSPMPVTTTLRSPDLTVQAPPGKPLLLRLVAVLLDVVHGLADARDLLRVLVGDLDAELLLEGHDQLDGVEAVRAEVVHEGRVRRDELLLDSELVHDDLLHAIGHRLHEAPPGPRCGASPDSTVTCGSRRPPRALVP